MNNSGYITIVKASLLTGKSQTTINKYIERGALSCKKTVIHGKECLTLKKSDIERIFNIICPHDEETEHKEENKKEYGEDMESNITEQPAKEELLTADKVRQVMEDFFSSKQAELIKPLEQQSLYRLGRVEQENQFLKEKLETLLEENRKLQYELKSLPDNREMTKNLCILEGKNRQLQEENNLLQSELKSLSHNIEITKDLDILEEENRQLQEENLKLQDELKSSPGRSIEQVLMDNANNLKILSRDKTELQERIREKEEIIKSQSERFLKEKEEALEEQKRRLRAIIEGENKKLIESGKKAPGDEKTPWWKFW